MYISIKYIIQMFYKDSNGIYILSSPEQFKPTARILSLITRFISNYIITKLF